MEVIWCPDTMLFLFLVYYIMLSENKLIRITQFSCDELIVVLKVIIIFPKQFGKGHTLHGVAT